MSKRTAIVVTIAVIAAFAMAMFGMTMLLAPHIDAAPSPEQQYVHEVRAVFAHDSMVPDKDLIKVGEQVCVALFLRTDEQTIVDVGALNGIAREDMTAVIEAAKKYLCDQ